MLEVFKSSHFEFGFGFIEAGQLAKTMMNAIDLLSLDMGGAVIRNVTRVSYE